MFCSLYGFNYLVEQREPLYVRFIFWVNFNFFLKCTANPNLYNKVFKILNEVYKVFDERISYFDVYKVESINEKYMVASGVPQPNGKNNF